MKKKIKLVLISLLLLSGFAKTVWGADLEISWPDSPTGTSLELNSSIAKLTKYFYEWGIAIGIIIFFGTLIYAGFLYITSAGKPEKLTTARQKIISGFSGVLLLLGSYLILNTINPALTKIKTIDQNWGNLSSYYTSQLPNNEENLSEFALIHASQENKESETRLTIPGLSYIFKEAAVFPEHSYACTPEKNEEKILDVQPVTETKIEDEVKTETNWLVLYNRLGQKKEGEENEVELGEETEVSDIEDLYAKRYEKVNKTLTIGVEDETIRNAWLRQAERGLYNSIYIPEGSEKSLCDFLITQSDFQKPRCIEVKIEGDIDGNDWKIKIEEWKRKGFPSLIMAFDHLKDSSINGTLSEQPPGQECPTGEEIYGEADALGYKRDKTGGGSNHAFYKGDENSVIMKLFGADATIPACVNQISRSSANMNSYRGVVDKEITCIEHIREERPIKVKDLTYDLTLQNNTTLYDCDNSDVCADYNESSIEVNVVGSSSSYDPVGALTDGSVERTYPIPAYQPVRIEAKAKVKETSDAYQHQVYKLNLKGSGASSPYCDVETTGNDEDQFSSLTLNCIFSMTSPQTIKLTDEKDRGLADGEEPPNRSTPDHDGSPWDSVDENYNPID